MHRNGSSNITLRGKGRYRVSFNANITGDINTQLVLAMAVDGEPVTQAIMGTSVGTAGLVNNVASSILVNVPCNCCSTISIKNNGAGAVTVYNANIVIEEV